MLEPEQGIKVVDISFDMLDGKVSWQSRIRITGDGNVGISCKIDMDSTLPMIPKIGIHMEIPEEYKHIVWYGKGPWENYSDRCYAAYTGLFEMDIEQFITPYIYPQENANRTGVKWIRVENRTGEGIPVLAGDELNVSAWPWTAQQLDKATHTIELPDK